MPDVNSGGISMYQLAVEIQNAKDSQVLGQLDRNTQEIEKIEARTRLISQMMLDLLDARDQDKKQVDLSHLQTQIDLFRQEHLPENSVDPFHVISPGSLKKVSQREIERCISDLQEFMRRDANYLNQKARESEFALQLYTTITEMLAKQKPDELRTILRHMAEGR